MSLPMILVTGGAGYVGSHTVLELLNAGYNIIIVDNMCNAHIEKGADFPEVLKRVEKITSRTVKFYNINILDRASLDRVFSYHKINCVIHFAAMKSVGESCRMPLTYYQNNITGTNILLEVMKKHGVFKLVFSSSATVYGDPQYLPIDEKHPTGQGCTNPYGKSKFFCEEIMKDLCTSDSSWDIIALRYFNPVGAHESGEIGEDPNGIPNNLMPFIAQVAVGKLQKLIVFGNDFDTPDGTGVRDYIHITDLAVGHIAALKLIVKPDFHGFKPINLGTGKGYSVLNVVEAFSKACGKQLPYVIAERRLSDVATSYADTSLAKKELYWETTKNIDAMCEDTWRWQKKNLNGFKTTQNLN